MKLAFLLAVRSFLTCLNPRQEERGENSSTYNGHEQWTAYVLSHTIQYLFLLND